MNADNFIVKVHHITCHFMLGACFLTDNDKL